jgi:nucleotide-binding universal stress UspA family protein
MSQLGPILVPTDFSSSCEVALELASTMALALGAEVVLLHVDPAAAIAPLGPEALTRREEARAELERVRQGLVDRSLVVRVFLRPGDPAREVLRVAEAQRPFAIVMGTHGQSRASAPLLGSVADRVLRYAPYPVVVVPHPERRPAPSVNGFGAS